MLSSFLSVWLDTAGDISLGRIPNLYTRTHLCGSSDHIELFQMKPFLENDLQLL
jgi:hypothetical protein